jgi:FkbM family methyltransferase
MKSRNTKGDQWVIDKELSQYIKYCKFEAKDVWLDLGSHIGMFASLCYDKVKHIYCVEPLPSNLEILKTQPFITNINVIEAAVVADLRTTTNLYVNEVDTCNNIIKKQRKTLDSIEVKCININNLIHSVNPNKIKMDIEGAEYDILKVMNFDSIEFLMFEWHSRLVGDKDKKYSDEDSKYKEIIDLVKSKFDKVIYKNSQWNGTSDVICIKNN